MRAALANAITLFLTVSPATPALAQPPPAPAPLAVAPGARVLASGEITVCALPDGGDPTCWGEHAGLIPYREEDPAPFVFPDLRGATSIAAGERRVCAVMRGGTVRCAGNVAEPRPDASVAIPGPRNVVRITAGSDSPCAVTRDGAVWCWGDPILEQPRPVPWTRASRVSGLRGAVDVAVGQGFACAVLRDGSVRCWGEVMIGLPDDERFPVRRRPVAVPGLTEAVSIDATNGGACVVRRSGEVWCFGSDETLRPLGPAAFTSAGARATFVGIPDAVEVTAGQTHACARRRDGSVWCWGGNAVGMLADGTTRSRTTPGAVDEWQGALAISAGRDHTCAAMPDRRILCAGSNGAGQLGRFPGMDVVEVPGVTGATWVRAEDGITCAGRRDAAPLCWGEFDGARDLVASSTPRPLALADAARIRALHSGCTVDDAGRARCWTPFPPAASARPQLELDGVAAIERARDRDSTEHGCVRRRDGTVACWSRPVTSTDPIVPAPVSGPTDVVDIAVAGSDAWAVGRDGRVWAWNRGAGSGNLVLDGAAGVVDVTLTRDHVWARTRDGRAARIERVSGSYGLAGGAIRDVAEVAADDILCVRLTSGQVRCRGYVDIQALMGIDPRNGRTIPGLADATQISVATSHACALRTGGRVMCWGGAENGQLGGMLQSISLTPAPVQLAPRR